MTPDTEPVRVVCPEGVHVSEECKKIRDLGWSGNRVALLGIWMTTFITLYVTLMVLSNSHSWFKLLMYASFSAAFAFSLLLPFRRSLWRNHFFMYFDWIAREDDQRVSFKILAVLVVSWVLFVSFLLLAAVLG